MLWKTQVEISFALVVAADDEEEAEMAVHEHVEEHALDVLKDGEYDVYTIKPVEEEAQLPPPWHVDCLPWGGEDERTIGEILCEE